MITKLSISYDSEHTVERIPNLKKDQYHPWSDPAPNLSRSSVLLGTGASLLLRSIASNTVCTSVAPAIFMVWPLVAWSIIKLHLPASPFLKGPSLTIRFNIARHATLLEVGDFLIQTKIGFLHAEIQTQCGCSTC